MHCAAYVRMPSYSIYVYIYIHSCQEKFTICFIVHFVKKLNTNNLYNDNQCTLMVVMKCAHTMCCLLNAVYILDEVHVYIA